MTIDSAMQRIEMIPISGCWLWTGGIDQEGYGIVTVGGSKRRPRRIRAHRYIYSMLIGEIPTGTLACHRCDVPCCVNPSHIFIGTDADNMRDKMRKGRHRFGRPTPALSPQIAREVRTARAAGASYPALAARFGIGMATVHRVITRAKPYDKEVE